jgi:hypothetical protein
MQPDLLLDPGYRRLKYCRYADDWVLGFTGPRREAEEIKDETGRFLREQLRLELSPAKTLITHGRTQAARFLGYEMVVMHADDKHDHRGHRSINAGIGLKVPVDVIRAKCAPYLHRGKPVHRTERRSTLTSASSPSTSPSTGVSRSTTGWRSTAIGSAT